MKLGEIKQYVKHNWICKICRAVKWQFTLEELTCDSNIIFDWKFSMKSFRFLVWVKFNYDVTFGVKFLNIFAQVLLQHKKRLANGISAFLLGAQSLLPILIDKMLMKLKAYVCQMLCVFAFLLSLVKSAFLNVFDIDAIFCCSW